MKHKIIVSITIIIFGIGGGIAQESPTASGGEATGTGGMSSYSVGQVDYAINTSASGSTAQGVQQPYEISVTAGIDETAINLDLFVYPNPTSEFLMLKVVDNTNLTYQIYDLQGKFIASKDLDSNTTTISLSEQANATYFLSVLKNNQIIKTFKIIKK